MLKEHETSSMRMKHVQRVGTVLIEGLDHGERQIAKYDDGLLGGLQRR